MTYGGLSPLKHETGHGIQATEPAGGRCSEPDDRWTVMIA